MTKGYRGFFDVHIREKFPGDFTKIIESTEAHYRIIAVDTQFARTSGNPIDKRLDFCAFFLALIKVLDEKGEDFQVIRSLCLQITTDYVQPRNRFQAYLKQVMPKLISTWMGRQFAKAFHKRVSVNASKDGFIANIITDQQETYGLGYGIDIVECGICKLFKKHNYFKYASILCEIDEITSSLAGLQLIRTGTIANGAEKCDFRFKRLK